MKVVEAREERFALRLGRRAPDERRRRTTTVVIIATAVAENPGKVRAELRYVNVIRFSCRQSSIFDREEITEGQGPGAGAVLRRRRLFLNDPRVCREKIGVNLSSKLVLFRDRILAEDRFARIHKVGFGALCEEHASTRIAPRSGDALRRELHALGARLPSVEREEIPPRASVYIWDFGTAWAWDERHLHALLRQLERDKARTPLTLVTGHPEELRRGERTLRGGAVAVREDPTDATETEARRDFVHQRTLFSDSE